MWFNDLPSDRSWSSLWAHYIRCGCCSGIRSTKGVCPVCETPLLGDKPVDMQLEDGRVIKVMPAFMGAEGRYEDWVYLSMLEREWKRPLTDADRFLNISEGSRPTPRAVIVIVFWSYFETRIERLL